jgi:hypothetical protein
LEGIFNSECGRFATIFERFFRFAETPFWLVLSFTWLFMKLGSTVFLGMSITLFSMAMNYCCNKIFTKMSERERELTKERTIEANQTIENIKMLKLYGW